MATIRVFLAVLGLAVAVPTAHASSHSPWYCYRLAPQFITSAVTPCTFPCLFISPKVHPRIIVQPELDGTQCHVAPSLDHKTQVGSCRHGVCTASSKVGHQVLKRKKRFICLIALAKLIRARKERKLLKEELEKLRTLNLINTVRAAQSASGGGVDSVRGNGPRLPSTNSAASDALEIHVIPSSLGGTSVDISGPASSRRVHVPNIIGDSNSVGVFRSGLARETGDITRGGRIINSGANNFNTAGFGGSSGVGINAASSDMGESRGMGSSGFTASDTVTSPIERPGHPGLGIRDAVGSDGRAATTVVGVAGVGVSEVRRGSGGTGSVSSGRNRRVSGGIAGVGGVISTGATGDPNDVDIRVGSLGASYSGMSTLGRRGIGRETSLLGSVGAATAVSGSRMDTERGYPRGIERIGPRRVSNDRFSSGGMNNRDVLFSDGDFGGDDGDETSS